MPRPVALLDVDDTILFDQELNTELLDSLKKNGVKDVYLFTDMTIKSSAIEERLKLKERLEKEGFTVHGLITPLDLAWRKENDLESRKKTGEQATNFRDTLYRQYPDKKFSGDDFELIMGDPHIAETFPSYGEILTRPLDQVQLGSAFSEAVEVYNSDIKAGQEPESGFHLSNNLNTRGDVAKMLGDHQGWRAGYSHTKGLMLEAFLAHKPEWVSSIIVADDNQQVIESVARMKESKKPGIAITTIHVDKHNRKAQEYDDTIKTHLQADPSKILEKIDAEIARLQKSKWNFFLSSPKHKITALNLLKEDIRNADLNQTSLADVVSNWEKSIRFMDTRTKKEVAVSEVLSQHRNILKSEFRSEPTSTQKLISDLKTEYTKMKQEFNGEDKKEEVKSKFNP